METKIEDRSISVSKELTKLNERIVRGKITEVKKQLFENKEKFKGEFVIVLEGKKLKNSKSINLDLYNGEINKLLSKFSLTDVVEIVHKLTGITKNKIYKWTLKLKKS